MKIKYIVAIILILYIFAKVYVTYTETKADDELPDHLKDIALRVLAVNDEEVIGYQPDNVNKEENAQNA